MQCIQFSFSLFNEIYGTVFFPNSIQLSALSIIILYFIEFISYTNNSYEFISNQSSLVYTNSFHLVQLNTT